MRGNLQCVLHAHHKSSKQVLPIQNASGLLVVSPTEDFPIDLKGLMHASTLPPKQYKALINMLQMYM